MSWMYGDEIGRMPGRSAGRAGDVARAGTGRGARAPRPGPTPGPPPPWGMQNVLCRLRCDTSAPNCPGLASADERVEVGAVEVDLAAALVHDGADVADVRLEHAVGRRVRDHQRGEVGGVLVRLRLEVVEVDVAVVVARHHDDPHARHHRAGGVGAVRRLGDEAHGTRRPRPGSRGTPRMASRPASSPCEPALGWSDTAS